MFKEFYYWMYWYIRKIKTDTDKEKARNAYILISAFQAMNIATVFIIINYYLKISLSHLLVCYIGVLMMLVLFVLNHFTLFAYRDEVFRRNEEATIVRRRKGKILFLLYLVISVFLLFYLASKLVTPRY